MNNPGITPSSAPSAGRSPSPRRRLVARLSALTMLAGLTVAVQAPAAHASAEGTDRPTTTVSSRAVANAKQAGQRATGFDFDIRVSDGTALRATNQAYARANCRNCRALAVSVQIVVAGHVKDIADAPAPGAAPAVRATNLAVAHDVGRGTRSTSSKGAAGCSRCATQALAYQYVIAGRHRLAITPAARQRLSTIEAQMRQVTRSGVAPATARTRLDALAAQIDSVLSTGVVLSPH